MRLRILILVGVLLVGAAFAIWRQSVARDAEETARVLDEASAAMKKLNQADAVFPQRFESVIRKVTSVAAFGDSKMAARVLGSEGIPLIDEHLALLDRAVTLSNAFLARKPNHKIRLNVDRIRRRADSLRKLRQSLADERAAMARGNRSIEEFGKRLQQAATSLLLDPFLK